MSAGQSARSDALGEISVAGTGDLPEVLGADGKAIATDVKAPNGDAGKKVGQTGNKNGSPEDNPGKGKGKGKGKNGGDDSEDESEDDSGEDD